VDKPLKSVTHGQCDARPTVTSSAPFPKTTPPMSRPPGYDRLPDGTTAAQETSHNAVGDIGGKERVMRDEWA